MAVIAIASAVVLFVVAYFFNDFEINEIMLISIAALVSAIPEVRKDVSHSVLRQNAAKVYIVH